MVYSYTLRKNSKFIIVYERREAFIVWFEGGARSRAHFTSVRCTGAENRLVDCYYSTDYFELYYYCDFYFGASAAVTCQRGTDIDSIVEYSKFYNWQIRYWYMNFE